MDIWDIKSFQDSKSFSDIYRKKDDTWLFDSECFWDIIWFQDINSFQHIFSKWGGE